MLLTMKFLVFLFILGPVKDCFAAINLETCRVALGMQTKEIKDEQLSSSSTYSEELLGARYARLGLNEGAGAWCPGNPISKDHNDEFLEINLLKLTVISLIAIQGRDNAESNAVEYATHFKLVYFRQSELPTDDWRRFEYRNYYNYTVMLGNNNPSQAISHSISPPIIAERVRVYPVNPVDVPLHVCMRVELYGCPYQ
ncbi:discoidin domain-containing receptor 2-like, partial [Saccoglossus kowalevskii]|uniref:Discoidin domain-containing receptor 2-like n=1 Tax=Saccoglossus kowalevskii TaxID=10224 RepID=A0ABM0M2J4_SACKO